MDYFELIRERHSIRSYTSQPLEHSKLQLILESINRAPSAGNLQSFEVYVVADHSRKVALARASWDQEFLIQAPVVLVFCAHPARASGRYGERGTSLYCVQDATIACTFAMLAAAAQGLATVWVGAFDEQAVQQIICSPEGQRAVAILPIGYANGEPRIRPRRSLEELIHQVQ